MSKPVENSFRDVNIAFGVNEVVRIDPRPPWASTSGRPLALATATRRVNILQPG